MLTIPKSPCPQGKSADSLLSRLENRTQQRESIRSCLVDPSSSRRKNKQPGYQSRRHSRNHLFDSTAVVVTPRAIESSSQSSKMSQLHDNEQHLGSCSTPFGLLNRLPQEMRELIYEDVFSTGHTSLARTSKALHENSKSAISQHDIYRVRYNRDFDYNH